MVAFKSRSERSVGVIDAAKGNIDAPAFFEACLL
jgi:hypothetical protein